jgi:hypothetical protein
MRFPYPDFSANTYKTKGVDGLAVEGKVEIQLSAFGDRNADFTEPQGWTWHHKEVGSTMELIPSDLHNNVPHSGGESVARDPSY